MGGAAPRAETHRATSFASLTGVAPHRKGAQAQRRRKVDFAQELRMNYYDFAARSRLRAFALFRLPF